MKKYISVIIASLALIFSASAQQPDSAYDAHALFGPMFYTQHGNELRTADGKPGPAYWQNRADYELSMSLDTATKIITGTETITYTNNSPDSLAYIWLQLDQQVSKLGSRSHLVSGRGGREDTTSGFIFSTVAVMVPGRIIPVRYIVSDSRMQIRLDHLLGPRGAKLKVLLDYHFTLPHSGGNGRDGYMDTRNGKIYDIAQWYPRLCVYDDIRGWNTLPFLGGGEFYLEYGDFDFKITVPWDMIVVASGKLENPAQVLTKKQIGRLTKASRSDQTVAIRSAEEVNDPATRPVQHGTLTWHYAMKDSRDIAIAASRAYVWDAARINLPGGKTCMGMSVYPVESQGNDRWGRATEFIKNAVEIFSRQWLTYPYPVAINAAGPVGGMEYPGITFDGMKAGGKGLWALLAHEIGHNWFPMVVGSDERRDAFMDEGFNTFIDIYASEQFNHGEFAPKRDGEYAPKGGDPAREIVPLLRNPKAPPIVFPADGIEGNLVHPVEYYKTALGLVLLRELILGPDRFDYAFRDYIHAWAFRHPQPEDFFRCIENGAGEDLDWFWREWFLHNWQLDQGIQSLTYSGNDPAIGSEITLVNLGKMALPVILRVKESGGRDSILHLPVEIWERGGKFSFHYDSTTPVDSLILDPLKQLPDENLANNIWTPTRKP
jgi:hypothetical protein